MSVCERSLAKQNTSRAPINIITADDVLARQFTGQTSHQIGCDYQQKDSQSHDDSEELVRPGFCCRCHEMSNENKARETILDEGLKEVLSDFVSRGPQSGLVSCGGVGCVRGDRVAVGCIRVGPVFGS